MEENINRDAELKGVIDFTRGRDWFNPAECGQQVTLFGCGGIGSPTALALAKLGIPKLILIDPDVVDKHNLPNQMFPVNSFLADSTDFIIDRPKVDIMAEVLSKFSVSEVDTHFDRAENVAKPSGIVVSGLDSMEARQETWKLVKYNVNVPFFVDARLGGENVVLYTLDPRKPNECERYEESLHSDGEALPAPCTRRSIIDVGFVVASLITRVVRRHLAGEPTEHTIFWNHASLNATIGIDNG